MSKPSFARSASAVLIVRTSWSSTMRRRGGARPLKRRRRWCWASGTGGWGLGVGHADVDVELAAGFLFLGGDEVVELVAGGEPFVAAVEEDVVDGQPAGGRVLPRGVDLEADAAALQGDDRFFERGQRADELGHLLAFDEAAVARVEDGVGQAQVEQLGAAFPLRSARSRCSSCCGRGTAAAGRRRRGRLRPARTSGGRRT